MDVGMQKAHHGLIFGCEVKAAAGHDQPFSFDQFVDFVVAIAVLQTTPSEGLKVLGREPTTKDVTSDADYSASVEHGIDACLAMVAHDEAAEQPPSIPLAIAGIAEDADLLVVVLEVAAISISTEVAPSTNDTITKETIMPLVAKGLEDGITDLTAYFAIRPDGGVTFDFGTHVDNGIVT